jgi:pyridoxal 5'-phosphate synthase pdxS subunit
MVASQTLARGGRTDPTEVSPDGSAKSDWPGVTGPRRASPAPGDGVDNLDGYNRNQGASFSRHLRLPRTPAAAKEWTAPMTAETSTWATKKGLAQMLKGGVIMDVVTPEHAKIAEDAGACAVMALERVPSDIRAAGGVARMSDPLMIEGIMAAVSIPVMAKARIGHFVEAQVLEALGVDYIDESEVLTPADEVNHIDKHLFKVPFVCGCRNLGEALRRINEGAAMIRTKGEAGTGDIVEAVRHIRTLLSEIRRLQSMREDELFVAAKEMDAPYDLVKQVAAEGKLPVVNFVAGGIAIPADAALAMQLGAEGVFVGSGIFKSENPARTAEAIVQATLHFDNPKIIAEVSKGLGSPMRGIAAVTIPEAERLAVRGW